MTTTFTFTDEATIKQHWKLIGDCRVEPAGVRVNHSSGSRTLLASNPPNSLHGNTTIEITCSMNVNCWVSLWELFTIRQKPGRMNVVLTRQGDTLSCSCNGEVPQVKKIKDEQINQGGTLRIYTSAAKPDGWIQIESIRITEGE